MDEYFLDEAKKILTSVYNSKTEYTYTNEHIAELLNFKPCDLEDSYAYYTEEQRKEAQKRVSKRYDDKRYSEKRKEKAKLKQYRRDFISQHMDMTAKELSETLKCSERTIRYIKADIRKEG